MRDKSPFEKFTGSTGTKHIWWLNLGAEKLWNGNRPAVLPKVTYHGNVRTVNRMEQLCFLLAAGGDIVIQRENPPDLLLNNCHRIGLDIPDIYILANEGNKDNQCSISELILKDTKLLASLKNLNSKESGCKIELAPYAVTHFDEKISYHSGCPLMGAGNDITAMVNSKVTARMLAEVLGLPVTEGYICHTMKEVKAAAYHLINLPDINSIVVKEAYGASGKGSFIVHTGKDYQMLMCILDRKSNRNKSVELIVERWYDTFMDLNYQIYIDKLGKTHYIPPKRQINDGSVYIGSEFPITDQLTECQKNYYEECAQRIGNKLWQKGYYGFASIDSIITKEGTIIPVVEINGRFSLSTYVSFIPERIGNNNIYRNRYYNLKPNITLEKVMERNDAYIYTQEKGEGIFIYSFVEGNDGISKGRLFALIAAEHKEKVDYFERKFVENMNKIDEDGLESSYPILS